MISIIGKWTLFFLQVKKLLCVKINTKSFTDIQTFKLCYFPQQIKHLLCFCADLWACTCILIEKRLMRRPPTCVEGDACVEKCRTSANSLLPSEVKSARFFNLMFCNETDVSATCETSDDTGCKHIFVFKKKTVRGCINMFQVIFVSPKFYSVFKG